MQRHEIKTIRIMARILERENASGQAMWKITVMIQGWRIRETFTTAEISAEGAEIVPQLSYGESGNNTGTSFCIVHRIRTHARSSSLPNNRSSPSRIVSGCGGHPGM